ncbi:hypothetical protein BJV82DRAFT_673712 [Fennellomyces sp. T-0311]|nr:hypothetical protein BJV82DRAFT_673712 [Fennellomyces sp. T-0311]
MKLSLTLGAFALFLVVVSAGKGGQVDNNNNEGEVDGFVNNFLLSGFLSDNDKVYSKGKAPKAKGH